MICSNYGIAVGSSVIAGGVVAVTVADAVDVAVIVNVGCGVSVFVGVNVGSGVLVEVGVSVGVRVNVGVGVGTWIFKTSFFSAKVPALLVM